MQRLILLSLACALFACSDDKPPSPGKVDAGETTRDSGTNEDDAGEAPASEGLERPPGKLERPPAKKLPDDLKPPGFAK
jgi:hypothetical protein